MQKTIVVWLGALICCTLWGSAYPCIKIGYGMFAVGAEDVASQILFAGCRFSLLYGFPGTEGGICETVKRVLKNL